MIDPQSIPTTPTNPPAQEANESALPQSSQRGPTQTSTSDTLAAPGLRFGRFTLQRFHARGGLGEVHVAVDEELRREVALKRMQQRCTIDPGARRRFINEAETTAKLEHPGVVPIHGLVHDESGQPCYAMRFIQGECLAESIRKWHATGADFAALPFRQLLQRFVIVCQTIAFAHSKHVIHRDIKPANIMLGPYGETLVVDWGLARNVVSGQQQVVSEEDEMSSTMDFTPPSTDERIYTQAGQALGTLGYMAPEQAAGRWTAVGSASDIYGLGATLYELLTGQRSICSRDRSEALQRAQAGQFTAPRMLQADAPKALEAICLKAMAFEPSQRYAAADELARDVEHWLADEPVSAFAESWSVRSGRWIRRHRTLAASAVAVLVMALVAVLVVLALTSRHATQLEQTNNALTTAKRDADDRFRLAKNAVDKYLNAITGDPDLNRNDFYKLRKKLLETAVPFYEQLAAARPADARQVAARGLAFGRLAHVRREMGDAKSAVADFTRMRDIFESLANAYTDVPAYRSELGNCYNALGIELAKLGQLPDAERALRRAIDIQEKLATDFSDVPEHGLALAISYNNLGDQLKSQDDRRREAEDCFRDAARISEKLVEGFPNYDEARFELANSYNNVGTMLQHFREMPKAEEAYRKGLEARKQLAAKFPDNIVYRNELAESHNNLGSVLQDLKRLSEAEESLTSALEIHLQLSNEFPNVARYRLALGAEYVNLGHLNVERGRAADSLAWYAKAISLLEPLVTKEPRLVIERHFLRNAHSGRARAFDKLLRHGDAVKDWDRMLELNQIPADNALIRTLRAKSLARAGDHARAVAEANALAEAKDVAGPTLYDLGCACALASAAVKGDVRLQDQYAARAVEILRQAVAKGYKDAPHMKQDRDLDALRERDDFKKLLAELEVASSSGKP